MFSIDAALIYIPINSVLRFPFFHILPNISYLWLLMIVILTGVRWYFIVLICVFVIISDIEHLFICLLAICISSLQKCLFRLFAHFWTGSFFFLFFHDMELLEGCLYTLDINHLSFISFANIFSHSIGFLALLIVFFAVYKFLNLNRPHKFIFISSALGDRSREKKKHCYRLCQRVTWTAYVLF